MALSKIVSDSVAANTIIVTNIADNTIPSAKLTTTGVVANQYGNSTHISVLDVDASGRITNATTSSIQTHLDTAYSNAVSVANTTSFNQTANAYANAVSDATNLAANAYANAVSDATDLAANAYANAISYASDKAANAYANATSYADAKAANAYANVFNGGTFTGETIFTSNITGNSATLHGSLQIDGSFTVSGGNVLLNAVTLVTEDNMLYLNEGRTANISNITGNGSVVIFTADNAFANGWDIYVYGVTPNTYNGTYTDILEANATHFKVSNTNTDSYTSGGTARAKMEMNPDLGLAGGYNDGTYHHAGVFRDATDGVWKFFHNYTPEPDASVYIDTSHVTFAFANVQANTFIGNLTGNANSATYLGGNTALTLRTYSSDLAANAYANATSYADTKAGTAYSNATSYAATVAGTAYSNATSYAATVAGTAYSNAVSSSWQKSGSWKPSSLSAQTRQLGIASPDGGEFALAYSGGQTYVYCDGWFYQNEGAYRVLDTNSYTGYSNFSGNVFTGGYFCSNHGNGYTQYKGYDNNNHFILIRGSVGGTTTSPSITGAHHTTFVEYAEANDSTGWFFKTAQTGNYDIVSRITRSYSTFEGSVRSPLFYDSNDTAYYCDPASGPRYGSLTVMGSLSISQNNTTGGGLILADDGDFVDLNDGYGTMRFSYGLRINSANRGGSAVITLNQGGNIYATAYYYNSDQRLKTNVNKLNNSLYTISKLNPVSFDWISNNKPDIGFIAQEVKEHIEEAVSISENDNDTLTLNHNAILAHAVKAIQELTDKVNELETKLSNLGVQ